MRAIFNWLPMILIFHERFCDCDIMMARAGIINTLHQRLHTGCTVILFGDYNGIYEEKQILELEKSLFELHSSVLTLHLSIDRYNMELENFKCDNERPPLLVLLKEEFIKEWIAKVFLPLQNPCQHAWLFFLSNDIFIEEEFSSVYVPFNCKFFISQLRSNSFHITELYRINLQMPVFTYPFGYWRLDNNWSFADTVLYDRRDSLNGLTMKGVSIENPPFTKIKRMKGGEIVVDGFIGAVWALLEETLNFTTIFTEAQIHGSLRKDNSTWSGLMEMLRTREMDVAVTDLSVTTERMDVIDYTIPMLFMRLQVFIRKLPNEDQFFWTNFLQPFSKCLWLMVTASIFVFSIVLHCFNMADCHFGHMDSEASGRHGFFSFLHYSFGVFCLQGQNMEFLSNSSRIVYITSYFTAIILLSAYSSSVISSLATKNEGPPRYRSIQDLLDDGRFSLGMRKKTATYDFFEKSRDAKIKQIFKLLVQPQINNLPSSEEEAFDRVCSKRYAHVSVSDTASVMSLGCQVTSLPDEGFPTTKAMGLVKNSPYKDIFNYRLQQLGSQGILKRTALNMKKKNTESRNRPTYNAVDLHSMVPILVVVIAGALCGLALLVLESVWHYIRRTDLLYMQV